jgi:hypothetical protein
LSLELGRGLGHGWNRGAKLFDPGAESAVRDAQIESDGAAGALTVEVHLDGGFFEFLIEGTSLFSQRMHSAIRLCPLPSSVSTKWGEVQLGQMGHSGHPGHGFRRTSAIRVKPASI